MRGRDFLNQANRRFGRYAIRNLMTIIVGGMGIVFLVDWVMGPRLGITLSSYLYFDRALILQGEVWRVLTFVFLPPDSSLLFILFSLYFYWMIGNSLENEWGSFRFMVYYLCGVLGTILSGFLTGYAVNDYLNLSLFLAFALVYPDYELLVFFLLPVKVKYLALLDFLGRVWLFIQTGWSGRLAILMALLNILLFFGPDLLNRCRSMYRRWQYRRSFR